MTLLTKDQIANTLRSYGVTDPLALSDGIDAYISALLKWNQKVSLTTVTDPLEILKFHFGESLVASSVVPIQEGRLADVGSGAGFPGLPLAMANSRLNVTLIESNAKKTAFLSEIVRLLHLQNATVARSRMEDFEVGADLLDFVTARALGQYENLMSWTKSRLSPTGKLALWLGNDDATKISASTKGEWSWRAPVPIPGSTRRVILAGSPI